MLALIVSVIGQPTDWLPAIKPAIKVLLALTVLAVNTPELGFAALKKSPKSAARTHRPTDFMRFGA
jgi:hypothetical protein